MDSASETKAKIISKPVELVNLLAVKATADFGVLRSAKIVSATNSSISELYFCVEKIRVTRVMVRPVYTNWRETPITGFAEIPAPFLAQMRLAAQGDFKRGWGAWIEAMLFRGLEDAVRS